MDKYEHIAKMEQIMADHEVLMEQLSALLDAVEARQSDYAALIEYYYSSQRNQDLEDDSAGRIPEDMKRGVLSEDGIFDLIGDYRDNAIRMMELAIKMIKL